MSKKIDSMASEISPKAEISPNAKIGNNCKIFPFVYIEDDVEIGDNCIIFPFVSICSGSRIGNNNKIHQGSVIAALPQDFNFRGAKSYVEIGDNNIIDEDRQPQLPARRNPHQSRRDGGNELCVWLWHEDRRRL